jgi:hypothetical protein
MMKNICSLIILLFISTHCLCQHLVADSVMGISYFGREFYIGKTDDKALLNALGANMYYKGKLTDKQWKQERVKSSWWNASAELVKDEHADLTIDSVRKEQQKFVPGYRIVVKQGYSSEAIYILKNIVLLYDHNILIQLTADVDSNFYKGMQHYSGITPAAKQRNDTTTCTMPASGMVYQVILKNITYTWTENGHKTEVHAVDKLTEKCKKYKQATITMTDIARYEAYKKLVQKNKR